ncbi:MAG: peptidase domain-containing ABC transporter [Cystobacter sp.]
MLLLSGSWGAGRRSPWVRAADPSDCGAAAFASIAGHHRHHLSLEQARSLVGTDRDGTSLAGLRDGGRAIGFDARPARATYEALAQAKLPAILHFKGDAGHYVVLDEWTSADVAIVDPRQGPRRMSREQLESAWSGYAVEFHPTPTLRTRVPDFQALSALVRTLLPHVNPLLLALGLSVLATAMGWSTSFFLKSFFDDILPARAHDSLMLLGAALVAAGFLQSLLQFVRMWLTARVGHALQRTYGRQYIQHLMTLPMRVFDSRNISGFVMRINQLDAIQGSLTEGLVALLVEGLVFAGTLGIIVSLDPVLALFSLCAVPPVLLGTFLLSERVRSAQLDAITQGDEFAGRLLEVFEGIRVIKIASAEKGYSRLLLDRYDTLTKARHELRVAMLLPLLWSMVTSTLVIGAVLWYGGARVLAQHISAGELLVVFGMVALHLNPLQRLPTLLLNLHSAFVGMERLDEVLKLPAEESRVASPIALPAVRGQLQFDRVSFEYKHRRPVLKDVSFQIAMGECVAIIGETGSGKSTIANLLAAFYLPTSGEVRIDGVSTREMDPRELRRHVSVMFQGSHVFQQSINDNITMMHPLRPDDVSRIAQVANIASFIESIPQGYNAQVAQGGANLSTGQLQRINIARAIMKDAPILILDESTSNLDSATERGVMAAIKEARKGRTTLIITHKLSTAMEADRVLVLSKGELVEQGSHAELQLRGGQYCKLFPR